MVRPGLNILRRDVRTLQLGFEWPGVATISASAAVRAVLDAVDGFRDVSGVVLAAAAQGIAMPEAEQAVEALVDAGALVDQSVVRPADVDEPTWSAMWLFAGTSGAADTIFSSRQRVRAHVDGSGRVATLVRSFLAEEKIPLTNEPSLATLTVVAADQEPPRSAADEAMRRGVPFICVGVRELVGLVGPFVVPGRTACLRCVDHSRAHHDSCWPTLVDSAHANPAARPAGPPSLLAVTAAYAAQEVALWTSGALPVSCDHVVEIPHGLGEVQTVPYQPHPQCGCGWQAGRETMSA